MLKQMKRRTERVKQNTDGNIPWRNRTPDRTDTARVQKAKSNNKYNSVAGENRIEDDKDGKHRNLPLCSPFFSKQTPRSTKAVIDLGSI